MATSARGPTLAHEKRVVRTESTFTCFESTRGYLARYGKPVAFYSDRATGFRVNQKEHGGTGQAQFWRVVDALDIDIIRANSAAARDNAAGQPWYASPDYRALVGVCDDGMDCVFAMPG